VLELAVASAPSIEEANELDPILPSIWNLEFLEEFRIRTFSQIAQDSVGRSTFDSEDVARAVRVVSVHQLKQSKNYFLRNKSIVCFVRVLFRNS